MIGGMPRSFIFWGIRSATQVVHILHLEVLHLGWTGNPVTERVANLQMKFLLKYRAQGIKVPIVVEPEGAGRMRSARRHVFPHCRRSRHIGVVNPRAGFKEHSHCGPLLFSS